MEVTQTYILISIIALLVIFILMFFVKKNKRQKRLTPLSGLAFVFVIFGIVFGDSKLVGYSLMGIGVLLSLIDSFIKRK